MPRIEAVEVRSVMHAFGGRRVLRGVTTRFQRGTVTFIEGPNGAGKSTLLGVVGMTLAPSSGTVWFEPIGDSAQAVRRELGWLAHDGRMYRELTGRENVQLAARLHGVEPVAGFAAVAARLGLEEFADQPVATLSRGQRQRVALARALVHGPSLLLLDEPLTGLDPDSAERLVKVIADERDAGAIVIVVSHTAGFPERVGGRRIRLERGRIVRDEPA